MVSGGLAIVTIVYGVFVLAALVLSVVLIALVFAAIRVLRLSAQERQLRIEWLRLRNDGVVGDSDSPGDSPAV